MAEVYERIRSGLLRVNTRSPVEHRFWSRVVKGGVVVHGLTPCWLWTGGAMKSGYGRIGELAHRYSYQLHKGPIPDGMSVLHECDTPACVNPDHLFLGTQRDNLADMRKKGRQVRGEDQGAAKLTEAQVQEIRRRYKRYSHQHGSGALAKEFGIGPVQVWRIAMGYGWKHV